MSFHLKLVLPNFSSNFACAVGAPSKLERYKILEISPQEASEIASSNLNVEDLLESTTTEVKVVIVNPSGRVEMFSSFQDKTKSMIANLCRRRWKTVANLAFAHPNVRVEIRIL